MRGYSEHLHRVVDAEIQRIVQEGLETARRMVRVHRGQLEALAARLLQQEVVEEEEIERILGPKTTEQASPPASESTRISPPLLTVENALVGGDDP